MDEKDPIVGKNGRIVVTADGPLLVSGGLPLDKQIIRVDGDGIPLTYEQGSRYPDRMRYALCRCGRSGNKPYCDGSHVSAGFDGTETAGGEDYLARAETTTGPELVLDDVEEVCAVARFCHRAGMAWDLVERSDDPEARRIAIEETAHCPSGRIVVKDRATGAAIEPALAPSLSLIEDPKAKVSGPLWVKGGVSVVSAAGTSYAVRNRVTLCRCGESGNKPFCDGRHVSVHFDDGDESLRK